MKKEWQYEGKKYIIYNDRKGNLYLNCHLCDCNNILNNLNSPNNAVVDYAKREAKKLLGKIEFEKGLRKKKLQEISQHTSRKIARKSNEIGISDVVFINEAEMKYINCYLFKFKNKKWKYEGKQFIVHYDSENNVVYLNGHKVRNCYDIWLNVDSADKMTSWRAKHKAKEIEIARLEASGVKIDRFELPETPLFSSFDDVWTAFCLILGFGLIFYFIYQVWWFFVGEWAFEGPFADDISAGEVIMDTIMYIVAFIVIIGGYFGRK